MGEEDGVALRRVPCSRSGGQAIISKVLANAIRGNVKDLQIHNVELRPENKV